MTESESDQVIYIIKGEKDIHLWMDLVGISSSTYLPGVIYALVDDHSKSSYFGFRSHRQAVYGENRM